MKKLLAVLVLAGCAQAAFGADVVGNAKVAKEKGKVENCIGCHGILDYKSAFPEVYRVPKIGGQSAKYIEAALQAYKKGDRKHPQMSQVARAMSDQDIADAAAYYAQQQPQ
jgi:cytochrome c553